MAAKNLAANSLALLALLAGCLSLLGLRPILFPSYLAISTPTIRTTAPSVLTVYYHERRPYYFKVGDQVQGLVADRAMKALRIAGIEFRWERLPPVRQLQNVRDAELVCAAIGWFASDERRAFAQFSEPIFQDGPFVALASTRSTRFPASLSIDELFGDPNVTVLVKDGYSYGAAIDQRLAELQARRVKTPAENDSMLQMLAEGRAELMLVSPDEALELIATTSAQSTAFRIVQLTHMPAGPTRHLMFSRTVSEEIVQRFDHALRQLPPTSSGGLQ